MSSPEDCIWYITETEQLLHAGLQSLCIGLPPEPYTFASHNHPKQHVLICCLMNRHVVQSSCNATKSALADAEAKLCIGNEALVYDYLHLHLANNAAEIA